MNAKQVLKFENLKPAKSAPDFIQEFNHPKFSQGKNIIGIFFLCLGSLISYAVLISGKDVNLLDIESGRIYIKFYTMIVASLFFLTSSVLSFLNSKYYIYFGNIALTMMTLVVINKIIEIAVFDFDYKNLMADVQLYSRATEKSNWQRISSSQLYQVGSDDMAMEKNSLTFQSNNHNYWKLSSQSSISSQWINGVSFSWRPHQLQFMAQGNAPYSLSRRTSSLTSSIKLSVSLNASAPGLNFAPHTAQRPASQDLVQSAMSYQIIIQSWCDKKDLQSELVSSVLMG